MGDEQLYSQGTRCLSADGSSSLQVYKLQAEDVMFILDKNMYQRYYMCFFSFQLQLLEIEAIIHSYCWEFTPPLPATAHAQTPLRDALLRAAELLLTMFL